MPASSPAPENSKSRPLVVFFNTDSPAPETFDDESITESDSEGIRAATPAPGDTKDRDLESKGEITEFEKE